MLASIAVNYPGMRSNRQDCGDSGLRVPGMFGRDYDYRPFAFLVVASMAATAFMVFSRGIMFQWDIYYMLCR